MSRTVDLFIDVDLSLEAAAGVLGQLVGAALAADGETRVLQDGLVRAVLAPRPLGEGDVLFRRYRFVLSAIVSDDSRPQDSAEAALLRGLAQRIHEGPAWPVLVVLDRQYLGGPTSSGAGQAAIGSPPPEPVSAGDGQASEGTGTVAPSVAAPRGG
jgi:hypothetical protein